MKLFRILLTIFFVTLIPLTVSAQIEGERGVIHNGSGTTFITPSNPSNKHILFFDYTSNSGKQQTSLRMLVLRHNCSTLEHRPIGWPIRPGEFRVDKTGKNVVFRKENGKIFARRFNNNFGNATGTKLIANCPTDEFDICKSRGSEYLVAWLDSNGSIQLQRLQSNLNDAADPVTLSEDNSDLVGRVKSFELCSTRRNWPVLLVATEPEAGRANLYLIRLNKRLRILRFEPVVENQEIADAQGFKTIETFAYSTHDVQIATWNFTGGDSEFQVYTSDFDNIIGSGALEGQPPRHTSFWLSTNNILNLFTQDFLVFEDNSGEEQNLGVYDIYGRSSGTMNFFETYDGPNSRRLTHITSDSNSVVTIYQPYAGPVSIKYKYAN